MRLTRPTTRRSCRDGVRPCPFVGCRYHLYLDVTRTGRVVLNFPDVSLSQLHLLTETCALDVAERGERSLEELGELLNVSSVRALQLERQALESARRGLGKRQGKAG